MQELEKQFIILTGIPGSGKTFYAQHLQREYSFKVIEADDNVSLIGWMVAGSYDRDFVPSCLAGSPLVAVEWGFRPDLYEEHVLALKKQGAKLVWFTGDEAIVYPAYFKEKKGALGALEARKLQMWRINQYRLPTQEYRTVETTRGSEFKPSKELDEYVIMR